MRFAKSRQFEMRAEGIPCHETNVRFRAENSRNNLEISAAAIGVQT
jgi:hypothetical protein